MGLKWAIAAVFAAFLFPVASSTGNNLPNCKTSLPVVVIEGGGCPVQGQADIVDGIGNNVSTLLKGVASCLLPTWVLTVHASNS